MLTLVPEHWYSWDFRVLEDGREVARLDRAWARERGTFQLGPDTFEIARTSMLRGAFMLKRRTTVLARAEKPSVFRRAFDVRVGATPFRVESVSAFRREFRVLRVGMEIGTIRPVGAFRRTAVVDLPDTVALPVRLFLAFLVLVLWKRQRDMAASGGGS